MIQLCTAVVTSLLRSPVPSARVVRTEKEQKEAKVGEKKRGDFQNKHPAVWRCCGTVRRQAILQSFSFSAAPRDPLARSHHRLSWSWLSFVPSVRFDHRQPPRPGASPSPASLLPRSQPAPCAARRPARLSAPASTSQATAYSYGREPCFYGAEHNAASSAQMRRSYSQVRSSPCMGVRAASFD
jgi:hypothetical protein